MIEVYPPRSVSDSSVATLAARLWADALAEDAESAAATHIIVDTPLASTEAEITREDRRVEASASIGAVAADRVISVSPAPRRRSRVRQATGEAVQPDDATNAHPRRPRSRRPRRAPEAPEDAAIPTLAELIGPLPVKHAVDSDAAEADNSESQALAGLMEDDNIEPRTSILPGGAESERIGASTLIDERALPKWMHEGQAEDSGATVPHPALAERDEASVEEEPITEQREAVALAPVVTTRDDERSEHTGLSVASLVELSPSQPLQGLGISEVAVPAQRSATTSKEKERAALQEDNEHVLLNLVGQLEDRWYSLNSPDSPVPPKFRRGQLIATARDITGLGDGEMRAILGFEGWRTLRHDVAAMLHTGERYAEADKLMRNQLGVSLNEFMALGIKSMQGDFYNGQRYAAGLSIRDAIFGYLKKYGFELPIRTHFDTAYTEMFGDRDFQSAPPVEQHGHRIVSGIDLTQIRSDLTDGASHAFARVRGWFGSLRLGERNASVLVSSAGVQEARSLAYASQQPSASGATARRQAQPPSGASDPARRIPPVPPRPALGSNPSGVRPAMASYPNRPGLRVPRELTAKELATFTADQFYEAGHNPKDLAAEVQERLARMAAQIRAEDGFLVAEPAAGEREAAPKTAYL